MKNALWLCAVLILGPTLWEIALQATNRAPMVDLAFFLACAIGLIAIIRRQQSVPEPDAVYASDGVVGAPEHRRLAD